jgi:hypothetical protein
MVMNVKREDAMKPTEQTKLHVISTYVIPARRRGEKTIQIKVGNVQKELGWTNRTPSVFSTLSSREFQQEAGVSLIEKVGGPPSGGPSTTVEFVYRVLNEDSKATAAPKATPNGAGLMDLYGIFADAYRQLGGGEEYLRRERKWGPDVWERYETQQRMHKKVESDK